MTAHGYPVRAVAALLSIAIFALPVVVDMGAVVAVGSNGALVVINDAGTHKACETGSFNYSKRLNFFCLCSILRCLRFFHSKLSFGKHLSLVYSRVY